jgi:phage baseplate assembly protein W
MSGMQASTGKRIEGDAHIAQSIRDILTTPIGTRVMRRDYGSRLPELIDAPLNAATRLLMSAATASAIARWEPRIRLSRVEMSAGDAQGRLSIALTAKRTDVPAPLPITLKIAL